MLRFRKIHTCTWIAIGILAGTCINILIFAESNQAVFMWTFGGCIFASMFYEFPIFMKMLGVDDGDTLKYLKSGMAVPGLLLSAVILIKLFSVQLPLEHYKTSGNALLIAVAVAYYYKDPKLLP
ncbi:hypothetical protein ACFL2B_00935 [Patescibacteria group bacterium]